MQASLSERIPEIGCAPVAISCCRVHLAGFKTAQEKFYLFFPEPLLPSANF
jgi:hypothetical protein